MTMAAILSQRSNAGRHHLAWWEFVLAVAAFLLVVLVL